MPKKLSFSEAVQKRAKELEVSSLDSARIAAILTIRNVNTENIGRSIATRLGQNPYVVFDTKGELDEGQYSGGGTKGASKRFNAAVADEDDSELAWLLVGHAIPSVKSMLACGLLFAGESQTELRKRIVKMTGDKAFSDYCVALGKFVATSTSFDADDVKVRKAHSQTASKPLRADRLAAARTIVREATAAQKAARPARTAKQQAVHKAEEVRKAAREGANQVARVAAIRAEAQAKKDAAKA